MIRQSFIFLDRVNERTEQNIWKQNIRNWDDFLKAEKIKGILSWRKKYYDRQVLKARSALYSLDSEYFYEKLPQREHWRLYDFLKEDAVFMDIETNGITQHAYITVIGMFDGIDTKTMIEGVNLNFGALKKYLKQFKLIVSFNGSVFDLPFVLKRHPDLIPKIPHFDLRFCCNKIGLKGGLKEIEKKLNIKRNGLVEKLCGGDALTLWRMYRATGDDYYLNLLIEYNEEDCMNLKTIAGYVYERMKILVLVK